MHMMVGEVFCGQWLESLKQEKEEKARGWKDERHRHCCLKREQDVDVGWIRITRRIRYSTTSIRMWCRCDVPIYAYCKTQTGVGTGTVRTRITCSISTVLRAFYRVWLVLVQYQYIRLRTFYRYMYSYRTGQYYRQYLVDGRYQVPVDSTKLIIYLLIILFDGSVLNVLFSLLFSAHISMFFTPCCFEALHVVYGRGGRRRRRRSMMMGTKRRD